MVPGGMEYGCCFPSQDEALHPVRFRICPRRDIVGTMRLQAVMCLVAIALMLAACAGSHYDISADRLNYPASLSPVLHDEQGKPCYLGEDLNSLGTFSFQMTSVGFLYSLIGTSIDLSDELNREVERLQGEGIVLLSLRSRTCSSSWFFPLTAFPIYPGCQYVTVSGTVVARKPVGRVSGRTAP